MTVRAVVSSEVGPLDGLVVEQVDVPPPGPGQALVRVDAASVNFPDVLLVTGAYQVPVPLREVAPDGVEPQR